MITSDIRTLGGVPTLFVNGKPTAETAYITYYTDLNRYADFADAGYRLFSVPIYFAERPINEVSQIPPFSKGIFDPDEPDFPIADRLIGQLLEACPDAMIFPRVNTAMTKKWETAHPDELCDTMPAASPAPRACFSSDAWLEETKRMLGAFIDHIEASSYHDRIVGYQIANGNTEEWFSFDQAGSVGKRSREAFARYCAERHLDGTETEYYAFLSEITADRICQLAAFTKEKTGRRLIVGSFYGYTLECVGRESCHHALRVLLDSPDVDFICSPVSYADCRPVGQDHACMLPVDTLKRHGKLYFAENDTRTSLSRAPNPLPHYNSPIWFGPDEEKSLEIIKMHFARALTHGYASWWFDMWGGWYANERYMNLMRRVREIAEESLTKDRSSRAETAVFVDERAYAGLKSFGSPAHAVCYRFRKTLGWMGAPYDVYLIDDYPDVSDRYKAAIFLVPCETPRMTAAIADAKEKIACLTVTSGNAGMTSADLRTFLKSAGVHLYADRDAVVYACGGYLFLHSADESGFTPLVPDGLELTELFGKPLAADGFGQSRLYAVKYT